MIVKKINNLALDIQKTPYKYWLNIMKQNKDSDTYYVIAGFDYDEEYEHYQINAIGDRLDDKTLDWFDFGVLVQLGYKKLKEKPLKELYQELERGKE